MTEPTQAPRIEDDEHLLFPPTDPAAYDAWFREQAEIGLREANDPNAVMIPHEEVMREMKILCDQWMARFQKERDAA